MNWGSAANFFEMGGYGLYVWGSYGVTALFVIIEVIMIKRRMRGVRQRLARMAKLQQEKVVRS